MRRTNSLVGNPYCMYVRQDLFQKSFGSASRKEKMYEMCLSRVAQVRICRPGCKTPLRRGARRGVSKAPVSTNRFSLRGQNPVRRSLNHACSKPNSRRSGSTTVACIRTTPANRLRQDLPPSWWDAILARGVDPHSSAPASTMPIAMSLHRIVKSISMRRPRGTRETLCPLLH